MLREPQERVRELKSDEAERLEEAARSDYEPFLNFARASGQRFKECLMLKWSDVDWDERLITTKGKGGRTIIIPIASSIATILWPLRGHHAERVFTYVAQRSRGNRVKGQRYPLTVNGTKSQWRRTRARAVIENFRFHDIRHDVGTKLLRETGNVKFGAKGAQPCRSQNNHSLRPCPRSGGGRGARAIGKSPGTPLAKWASQQKEKDNAR